MPVIIMAIFGWAISVALVAIWYGLSLLTGVNFSVDGAIGLVFIGTAGLGLAGGIMAAIYD